MSIDISNFSTFSMKLLHSSKIIEQELGNKNFIKVIIKKI